jgi:hypothetical protein
MSAVQVTLMEWEEHDEGDAFPTKYTVVWSPKTDTVSIELSDGRYISMDDTKFEEMCKKLAGEWPDY